MLSDDREKVFFFKKIRLALSRPFQLQDLYFIKKKSKHIQNSNFIAIRRRNQQTNSKIILFDKNDHFILNIPTGYFSHTVIWKYNSLLDLFAHFSLHALPLVIRVNV